MPEIAVRRFDPSTRLDFYRLHSDANEAGWCFCVAWWVPTWEGWMERTAEENRAVREQLCDRGEYDGYLLYVDGVPVGWCQVGPRDRLEKLVHQYGLTPNSREPSRGGSWAITCFFIAPGYRRRGLASCLLGEVVRDLRTRGVPRIVAFPKRGKALDPDDCWTGPEEMFRQAGFAVLREDPRFPIYALDLTEER